MLQSPCLALNYLPLSFKVRCIFICFQTITKRVSQDQTEIIQRLLNNNSTPPCHITEMFSSRKMPPMNDIPTRLYLNA